MRRITEKEHDELANATLELQTSYFALNAKQGDLPKRQEVHALFDTGREESHVMDARKLTAHELQKAFVCLRIPSKNRKDIENWVKDELQEHLYGNCQSQGLYLEQNGILSYNGRWFANYGNHILGNPSALTMNRTDVTIDMPPTSRGAFDTLMGILMDADPKILVALTYLAVTMLRSQVRAMGNQWQAVLMIVGKQGFGKTTLARLLVDWIVDAQTAMCPCFFSAGSTPAGLQEAMTNMRDLPVVVDDLCLSASPRLQQKYKDTGAQLVREGTAGSLITKKVSPTETRTMLCEAGLIFTAEFALENPSDITRCLYLNLDKPLHLPPSLTSETIGAGMLRFVELFLLYYRDTWLSMLQKRLQIPPKSIVHPRIWNNLQVVQWGWDCLTYAAKRDGFSAIYMETISEGFYDALNASIRYQDALLRQVERRRKKGNLAEILLNGLQNGAFDLAKKLKKLEECDGMIWKKDLCLFRDALERYVRQQDGYAAYTIKQITRELQDIGALVVQESGTLQVKLKSGYPRVYRIRIEALEAARKQF